MKYLDRSLVIGPYIALCTDENEFKREMRRLNIPDPPEFISKNANATTQIFDSQHGVTCIVCIRREKERSTHEINGLLIHEGAHIWQATREEIGEDKPSHEFEAYALQNICQRLMEAFHKPTEKRMKKSKGGKGKGGKKGC